MHSQSYPHSKKVTFFVLQNQTCNLYHLQPLLQSGDITSPLDYGTRRGRGQAACSIWWTPARLQSTRVNKSGLCDHAKSPKIWASVYSDPQSVPKPSGRQQRCLRFNRAIQSPNQKKKPSKKQSTKHTCTQTIVNLQRF